MQPTKCQDLGKDEIPDLHVFVIRETEEISPAPSSSSQVSEERTDTFLGIPR
jgi:hypothetical protein